MPITRLPHPHFTLNDLILIEEAQEITFDIFEILPNFCDFLCFFENFQKLSIFWGLKSTWSANLLDIFKILLNFSVFLIFLEIIQILKPLIGWDTALLKLKICVLQRDSEPNTAHNSLIGLAYNSKWPHIDWGISGDHVWHFWNFAEFLWFSVFFWKFSNAFSFLGSKLYLMSELVGHF